MESKGKERYLMVQGNRVAVSEEVFQAVFQQINHTRYMAKREDRCAQPNHCHCSGDCETCRYQQSGKLRLGFEFQSDEAAYAQAICQECGEDILMKKEMWRLVYQYADQTVAFGEQILRMRIEKALTLREIADALGLRTSHVDYKLRRIYAVLKQHPEIFF